MKITFFLLLASFMTVSASTLAQKITLNTNGAKLESVLEELKQQSGYSFIVDEQLLDKAKTVTLHLKNADISQALDQLFETQQLTYTIEDKVITIKEKQPSLLDKLKNALNLNQIEVTGTVLDEQNRPIPGATVTVKGTGNATITNAKGEFNLKNVPNNATIVISFIGYQKQELSAAADMGKIKLVVASNELDAVQVIAYGQTTERLTTGNISSISSKEIENQPVSNPLLALENRVPGLFISPVNGLSGSGIKAQIQGQNSIQNGNDPLIVIDGIPYPSQMPPNTFGYILGGSNNGAGQGNTLSFINPNDIQSIEVLKDADATTIYGSRAANGAILIITKKGVAGATKVNVNLQNGWGKVGHFMDLLNTPQYLQMRHEAINNDGLIVQPTDYDINGFWDTTRNTNWQKAMIGGTDHYTDDNVSISGGNSNTQFLVGSTFHRETTVYPGDFSDEKGSVHFNVQNSSNDQRFHVQLSGSYLINNNQLPYTDETQYIFLAPDAPSLYNPNGTLNWDSTSSGASSFRNPLAYLNNTYQQQSYNLTSNANLSYQILPNLAFTINSGYNNLITNEFFASPLTSLQPELQANGTRSAAYSNSTIDSWSVEPQLDYKLNLAGGKLESLVGATIEQDKSNGTNISGSGYNSDDGLRDIQDATTLTVNQAYYSLYKYAAVFGRINYDYKDKYIINVSGRRDGSSRFGSENQFHDFGSVGAAWIFSEEHFLKNSFLSFGKLRASYGITGNDQIGDYKYLSLYNTIGAAVPYQNVSSLVPGGLPNPYLQWETNRKLQMGLDLGFLNDRLLITGNYAINKSSNQLLPYTVPNFIGFNSVLENFPATVQNKDWEFTINSTNIKNTAFAWHSSINLTIPSNKLIAFPNLSSSSYANSLVIGQPITIEKVYHFEGVDPATGQYKFASKTDPFNPVAPDDQTGIINLAPKFYGGLQNTFSYKSFQLEFLFSFVKQIGRNLLFNYPFPGQFFSSGVGNQSTVVLSRWQKPGDVTDVQKYTTSFSSFASTIAAQGSDAAYSDASYARLKNLSFSYELPDFWKKKMKLQNLRVYIQGENIFTITGYKGLDPETLNNQTLPPLRVISLGVQGTF